MTAQLPQDEALLSWLQDYMQQHIPLTRHLGLSDFAYEGQQLSVHCPLAPNRNDKGTAFAGSLSAAATVCGWGLVTLLLTQPDRDLVATAYDVVIGDSHNEYLLPVTEDFTLRARLEQTESQPSRFMAMLNKRGKARIAVIVEVHQADRLCFRLSGQYVARVRS